MARDNERIVELLANANASARELLIELVRAEARPQTLMSAVEQMRCLEVAFCDLGEGRMESERMAIAGTPLIHSRDNYR